MNCNYINILFIIIIISLIILYINDINDKLDILDDKEHLSQTQKKKFSGKQIAIITVVVILITFIPLGLFILFSMKKSSIPLEQ